MTMFIIGALTFQFLMVGDLGGNRFQIYHPGAEKVGENTKIKIVRNGRGKVMTSPQRARGLPKRHQNKNRSIYENHCIVSGSKNSSLW